MLNAEFGIDQQEDIIELNSYGPKDIFTENLNNPSINSDLINGFEYNDDSILDPKLYNEEISEIPVMTPVKRVSSSPIEILPKRTKSVFDKSTEIPSINIYTSTYI